MARPKIVIATVNDRTAQMAFTVHVRPGMGRDEIVALLDLANFRVKTSGPDGHLDDHVAQAATGPAPRPLVAIGTQDEGTPDEKLIVKVRRGAALVDLVGVLRLAEFQVNTGGVHGFLDGGVEVVGVGELRKLGIGLMGAPKAPAVA